MPYPDALKTNPKVIFFTDFDGTITQKDTNDYMVDNHGFGYDRRRELNKEILDDTTNFRDGFRIMLESVQLSFPDAVDTLVKNITLDPGFKAFFSWARANNVPVVVLSSGMVPIIKALLAHLVGPEADEIEVVANGVTDRPGKSMNEIGGWEIVYQHPESGFGHDKSKTLRPYAEHVAKMPKDEQPTLLYAGDGVSDLSAARETDLLFAKKGHDLITFCEKEKIPFTVFEDWNSILEKTKEIHSGQISVKKLASEGHAEAEAEGKA